MGSWVGVFGSAEPHFTHAMRALLWLAFVTHAEFQEYLMPTITLDKIKADIEAKYAPVVIDLGDATVTLTQVMRLSKAKRAALVGLEKARETKDADGEDGFNEDATLDYLRDVLRLVATDKDEAEYLIDALGDDLVFLTEVVTAWREGTQAGEASPSAS